MKKTLIDYIKRPKYDELYTPEIVVYPLLKYLPKGKIYWECTDFGGSNITKVLTKEGFKVRTSGLLKDGFDFLTDEPSFEFDIIITNPPYSLKNHFLKKCYEYKKPFALLLPLTALEGIERGKMFRKYGIQVLVLDKRISFLKHKNSPWFAVAWFCWRLLPRELVFESLKAVSGNPVQTEISPKKSASLRKYLS
ncbi:MAG TPA: tRNA (adenine-N(6)-)-methyltransferase [Candidatus Desulfofervidus auxilii]|uniref:tRNA (Adenine-N(6)-)-methyltransferase n=1 Tax=Desulfofervidus auxilii TaxID=1621989 RepID=A0A7C0U269_DESA2|nr:tRNA (adenine-N(6)-)-methyltransferase [Candidatus Desulfofervidus auxilii]